MAMLAEKKYKSKMCADPRNVAWSSDTGRFGFKMLEKMGWEKGKGLGANEDGTTSHVKVTRKGDNKGVGSKSSNEDNWLSHQFAFDDLLSKLNNAAQNGTEAVKKESQLEMEKKARNSRKRVFYNKFIKSKDLSSKTSEDMQCIFGKKSVSMPVTPVNVSDEEDSDDSSASCPTLDQSKATNMSHGITTITAQHSIQDYFAKKMEQLKQARESTKTKLDEVTEDGENRKEDAASTEGEETARKKDKKLKKRKIELGVEETKGVQNNEEGSSEKKSGKKKRKTQIEDGEEDHIEGEVSMEAETIGEVKKNKLDSLESESNVAPEKPQKKKKRKERIKESSNNDKSEKELVEKELTKSAKQDGSLDEVLETVVEINEEEEGKDGVEKISKKKSKKRKFEKGSAVKLDTDLSVENTESKRKKSKKKKGNKLEASKNLESVIEETNEDSLNTREAFVETTEVKEEEKKSAKKKSKKVEACKDDDEVEGKKDKDLEGSGEELLKKKSKKKKRRKENA